MEAMCFIKVVYHTMPDQAMKALNYYALKPKILGQPLTANTTLYLSEETIRENQGELEQMVLNKIISITMEDGKPFQFDRDTMYAIPAEEAFGELPSLEALLAEDEVAEQPPPPPPSPLLSEAQTVALDAEGLLPADPLGDLRIPDELPPEQTQEEEAPKLEAEQATVEEAPKLEAEQVPGEDEAPKLKVITNPEPLEPPPEMPSELQSASDNDRFFDEVEKYVGSRRKRAGKTKVRE